MRTVNVVVVVLCLPAAVRAQDLKSNLDKKLTIDRVLKSESLDKALEYMEYKTKIKAVIDPRFKTADVKIFVPDMRNVSAATVFELIARQVGGRTMVRQGKLVLEAAFDKDGSPLPKPKLSAAEAAARKKMLAKINGTNTSLTADAEFALHELLEALSVAKGVPVVADEFAFMAIGLADPRDARVKVKKQRSSLGAVLTDVAAQVGGQLEVLSDVIIIVPDPKKGGKSGM